MRHDLEQEVLDDNKECYDLCINLAYLIEHSKHKEKFKEIQDSILKKASGYKMLIDYMNKNQILPSKEKTI